MTPLRVTLVPGALAAGLGLFASLAYARHLGVALGLPLDDAWIHAAFARNLAQHGIWGLFAGQSSGGESSPLWPCLLAVGEWTGSGGAPRLALLLGGIAWLLLPGVAGTLASRPARGRMLAVIVGLCGPLLFMALSGMESLPALLVGLIGIGRFGRGHTLQAGVLVGVAALLRPEAALLLAVLALGEADRARADGASLAAAVTCSLRRLAPGLVVAVAGVAALALAEGRWMPATLAGRRWILGLDPLSADSLGQGAVRLVRDWFWAIPAELGLGHVRSAAAIPAGPLLGSAWKLAAAVALFPGVVAEARRAGRDPAASTTRLLAVWSVSTLLLYALLLPDRGHVGRYQPQIYVLLLLVAVEGIATLARRGPRMRGGAASAAVLLGLGLVAGYVHSIRTWSEAVDHIQRVHVRAAVELAGRLPADAAVGVFDVGAVAYFHRGHLVDLSGLSDPDAAADLARGDVGPTLARGGASFVLLPRWWGEGPGSLPQRLGLGGRVEDVVVEYRSSLQQWGSAFAFSGNAFPRLVLSRLTPPASP